MTIKELIKDKNYDCIEMRITLPEKIGGGDTLMGYCESKNGELLDLDGDTYDENWDVLSSKEWENETMEVYHGLTILIEGEWI